MKDIDQLEEENENKQEYSNFESLTFVKKKFTCFEKVYLFAT
jgi:hypothetical protein